MSDIVSKFSVYDILAMVLPGGMLLFLVNQIDVVNNWTKQIANYGENTLCSIWIGAITLVLAYVVGLISFQLTNLAWEFMGMSNNPLWIRKNLDDAKEAKYSHVCKLVNRRQLSDKVLVDIYFEAYTYAKMQNPYSCISTIEGQVAMLKGMIIPTIALGGYFIANKFWWLLLMDTIAIAFICYCILCNIGSTTFYFSY